MVHSSRSYALLLSSLVSLLFCAEAKVSNVSPFPYAYWKPSTGFTRITTEKPTTKTYNYFYGDKVKSPSDVNSWDVLPIKVPNDIINDINYENQYERRVYQEHKESSLKSATKSKIKQLVRNSWPSRLLSRWKSKRRSQNHHEPVERNYEDAPSDSHEFYPMETSDGLTINLLQRDGNHLPYQPGYNPDRVNYNILDYSRYQYHNQAPTIARKKYNENLVDMMTTKMFGKNGKRYNYQTLPNAEEKEPGRNILYDDFAVDSEQSTPSTYSNSYQYGNDGRQPSYQTPPPKSNYTPSKRFTNWLKSKTTELFKDTFQPVEKYVPNLPSTRYSTTVKPKHFLYYYNSNHIYDDHKHPETPDYYEDSPSYSKWSLNGYKKKGANSIMERIAHIQQAPSTLLLPGGLAAVGMGLALYYFNYVWYPTPVVTAKMSRLILNILNTDILEDNSDLQKVVEVFRSLEDGEERNVDCQKRLVCQLHQEIPGLWEVTRALSPLVRSQLTVSSEEPLEQYLTSAESGRTSSTSCKDIYTSCRSPYVPFRPFLNSIFTGITSDDSDKEESRVLN